MAENSDFVPSIERALRAPDPKAALLEALRTITTVEPKVDGAHFDRFMESAMQDATSDRRRLAREVDDLVQELMYELATDTFKGDEQDRRTAVDLILARPTWRKE